MSLLCHNGRMAMRKHKLTPRVSEQSTIHAVIYVGPSSVNFSVIEGGGDMRVLDYLTQPVPVARDVFRLHRISSHTMDRAVQVVDDYMEVLAETYASFAVKISFVMTNILSEARNLDVFINRMHVAHGLRGKLIDDGNMTRLIYIKVQETLSIYKGFNRKKVLVLHLGPGNTRVLMFDQGRISRYSCYRFGTHRTGEAVADAVALEPGAEVSLLREQLRGQLDQIRMDFAYELGVDGLIVVGHEMQTLQGVLHGKRGSAPVPVTRIFSAAEKMATLSIDQRMMDYDTDFARVASLLPALLMTYSIAQIFSLKEVLIPRSLYNLEFVTSYIKSELNPTDLEGEVLHFAGILADRYTVDARHRNHVLKLCVLLFEQLQDLHRLSNHDGLLLQVAALLHEVGVFVAQPYHELHSEYIILNTEIFGLSREDVELVALLARYHRHQGPSNSDSLYADLDLTDRMRVAKLAAILRLADALERSRTQRVKSLVAKRRGKTIRLELEGIRELAIEELAVRTKGDLFTDIFGCEVELIPAK